MTLLRRSANSSPVRELVRGASVSRCQRRWRKADGHLPGRARSRRRTRRMRSAWRSGSRGRASGCWSVVGASAAVEAPREDPEAPLEREVILWNNIIDLERSDLVIAVTEQWYAEGHVRRHRLGARYGHSCGLDRERGASGATSGTPTGAVMRVDTRDPLRSLPAIATAIDAAMVLVHP